MHVSKIGVVLGVLLSQFLNGYEWAVPWIFAFITFAGSLSANFQSLRHAFSKIESSRSNCLQT